MSKELYKINLNLLLALDALLKEKHVTNAGKRLFITQSAMSNLLKQLREILQDDLFIRGRAGRLIPTAYAKALEPKVEEALEKLADVFEKNETFDPSAAKITFTLGLSDYTEHLFLPPLTQFILKEAPGIKLIVKQLSYVTYQELENDEIDLAIITSRIIPDKLCIEHLYNENIVCMGAKNNPLLKKPVSLKDFASAKHLVILYSASRAELKTEQLIKAGGYERDAIVTVPNTLSALNTLIGTELITGVLSKLAARYRDSQVLTYQAFAFDVPSPEVRMTWHPKHKNNVAHQWLRQKIREISKTL